MGPWNPWLHEARIGKPIWDLTKALSAQSNLPDPARQVAILVTGAHFHAGYEIYAHVAVAEHPGERQQGNAQSRAKIKQPPVAYFPANAS